MRVVFLGTSEFAIPTLRALAEDDRFDLRRVLTQPDARAGRGRKVSGPPVRDLSEELGLPLEQPDDVNAPEVVEALRAEKPDVLLTAAYGQKLSDELLALPARYALNLHASLLPRHRGAAPVHHAVISGDQETGVTLMGMTSRMDAGPIYGQRAIPIEVTDTCGDLLERLADLGRDLLLAKADAIAAGKLRGKKQDESLATQAPQLEKENGRIFWDKTAPEIDRLVRGMTPLPGAWTTCPSHRGPQRLLVVHGAALDIPSPAMPGTVVAFTSAIEVAARQGIYQIIQVKRSGKRSLSAVEFLRGFPLPVGTRLH